MRHQPAARAPAHPRATELLYVIDAEFLRTAHVEENGGARTIVNDLKTGSVKFFPQGLIHYQQNLGCKPATYISALNSEDPGVVTITTRFFELPPRPWSTRARFELVAEERERHMQQRRLSGPQAADSLGAGDADVERLIAGLPAGPAAGRAECIARCDLWHISTYKPVYPSYAQPTKAPTPVNVVPTPVVETNKPTVYEAPTTVDETPTPTVYVPPTPVDETPTPTVYVPPTTTPTPVYVEPTAKPTPLGFSG